jgi:hypothetical protein
VTGRFAPASGSFFNEKMLHLRKSITALTLENFRTHIPSLEQFTVPFTRYQMRTELEGVRCQML